MPIYLYQVVLPGGEEGEVFECEHGMNDRLKVHPESGEPVRRVYAPPNLGIHHTDGKTKNLLSNENLERKGFTKYERDKVSGKYHKLVGDGPSVIDKPPA